ncbi:unnamed protein product [Ixodes persulcatus]
MDARTSLRYPAYAVGCALPQSFKKLGYLGPVLKEYSRMCVLCLALLCLYVRCALERGVIVSLVIRDGRLTLVVPLLRRSHSRSPMSNRRRHIGSRDNPNASRCLGVFGLSLYTQERDLKEVFSKYGPLEDVQVVYDAQSGRSRGFSFVYFENVEDAKAAKDRCNGLEIDGRKIRVDYSITQRAHTPTPGIYMGKPSYGGGYGEGSGGGGRSGGGGGGGYRGGYRDRSPSPYYSRGRRGYSRSRSRSYSPRRYGYY